MAKRYNAAELTGPLPEDVNDTFEAICANFGFGPFVDMLKHVREKRLHGKLSLIDSRGRELAMLNVRRGIVNDGDLLRTLGEGEHHYRPAKPFVVLWRQHILNDRVSWKKESHNA